MNDDIYYNWENAPEYKKELTASCLSYIINKKGSHKLMKSTYKNNKYKLDPTIWTHAADGYIYLKTNTYCYKYPMFIYNDEIDSTIDIAHLSINKPSKDEIVKQYKKLYPNR